LNVKAYSMPAECSWQQKASLRHSWLESTS